MSVRFQKCSPTDLDQLIDISRTTFVDAFEKDNAPDDFKAYIDKTFTKANIQEQLVHSDSTFYFAFKDEILVGYFKLNENTAQTDVKLSESVELERIYVVKEFQGNQIGKEMLHEALRLAEKAQKTFLWLGVWQKNTGAVRFYEKHGFVKFGTHPYYIGDDKQTDWLMRYDLINFRED
ncbi:MAG: GNAT family N-acetyltransferase [Maribacter sp.]